MSRLGIRVLCVAPDEAARAGVASILDEAGYEVEAVAGAAEAHAHLAEAPPNLVVSVDVAVDAPGVPRLAIARPIDVDALLARVDDLCAGARAAELARARAALAAFTPEGGATPRVTLALYVGAPSSSSLAALRNLWKVLSAYDPRDVAALVRDAADATGDGVAIVPSLVKRAPAPAVTIRGGAGGVDAITDLLRDAGVYARDFPDEETDL